MREPDLLEVAGYQHGYFTAAQAVAAGVSHRALTGRVHRGIIERVARGVYRMAHYPVTSRDDLYILQVLAPGSLVSHETALEVYALSDVLPRTIHITVPVASGMKPRPGVTIHRSDVPSADRTIRDDLRVTGLTRTLLDCARTGSAPEQLLMAVREGRARGMLRPADIARLRAVYPFRGRIR